VNDPYLEQVFSNFGEDGIRARCLGTHVFWDNSRIYRFDVTGRHDTVRYYVKVDGEFIISMREVTSGERKRIGKRLKARARRRRR